tara:strand:+ start:285 stop:767 length:483 start_codon:yes stop_codon:yes gene_type:complete
MNKLSHIDVKGEAKMVDVGEKTNTKRRAVAGGFVSMKSETLQLVVEGEHKKGDVLSVAKIAGIQAAKNCYQLIPLCHPLMLTSVSVDFEIDTENNKINIITECGVNGATGVEMEALTAASVAGLTIYDMCKAVDKEMSIGPFFLKEKSGGKSGHFVRKES